MSPARLTGIVAYKFAGDILIKSSVRPLALAKGIMPRPCLVVWVGLGWTPRVLRCVGQAE